MIERYRPKLASVEAALLTNAPLVCAESTSPDLHSLTAEDEARLVELALLDDVAYDRAHKAAACELKLSIRLLDKLVEERRPKPKNPSVVTPTPEPWPESVNADALLTELSCTFQKHVIAEPEGSVAIVLWLLFSHTHDCWTHSPALHITAPTPDFGKTTAVKFCIRLVNKPLAASNVTPAVVFRVIAKMQPTFLIDEADAYFREKPELRSILDSGHDRDGAFVLRCEGDNFEPKSFSTWCPKVIAGIGKLHQTLESRAVKIELRRKSRAEVVETLPHGYDPHFDRMLRQCIRWAKDNAGLLKDARPELPKDLSNRAADNWRPLIAIADAAGGDWPKLARAASIKITAAATDDTYAIVLLSDLRKIFAEEAAEGGKNLATTEIIEKLCAMEDRPWPEFSKTGKPITPVGLARLLKPFGIAPRTVHLSSFGKASGYDPAWFTDEFQRYLPPEQDGSSESDIAPPPLSRSSRTTKA